MHQRQAYLEALRVDTMLQIPMSNPSNVKSDQLTFTIPPAQSMELDL